MDIGTRRQSTWIGLDRATAPMVVGVILILSASSAQAAGAVPSIEVTFFAALAAIILMGLLLGEAMNRIGQPSVMGQLLAGILLGPSVLGWLWPDFQHWLFPPTKDLKLMLDAVSQVGILLLLLLTGMETDLKLVRKAGKSAISISLTGVAVPFACGVALAWLMPASFLPDPEQRLLTSLFLGTALSISSIKIVAVVVREMEFGRRNLGQTIVASAIMEDTIGWVVIAITFSLAAAGGVTMASVAKSLAGTVLFLVVSFTIGRQLVSFLIRWTNDNFESDFPVITTILLIMIGMALTTHFIGVHTVLGAFVAGVLIGESPILTKYIDAQLRGLILAFFMPVFFGVAGLNTDLTILSQPNLLLMTLGLIVIASLAKFAGAFMGAAIGGLTRREALAVGCGMNARGSTEIIVATIGLSFGAFSQDIYTMIVAMALTTTMAMPPMLRWALSRVPIHKTEKKRLEREASEAKEFIPNLERLLLAVDGSPNGQFTSRIAGLVAGRRGMPITVLQLGHEKKMSQEKKDANAARAIEATVKDAASSTNLAAKDEAQAPVNVIVREKSKEEPDEIVIAEAKKGYDLLLVGTANMKTKAGTFNSATDRLVGAFDGPTALVIARDKQLESPHDEELSILVPVAGTDISRRAAEIAFSLGTSEKVTAVYVEQVGGPKPPNKRSRRRHARTILIDIVELASSQNLRIATRVLSGVAADKAILSEAKAGKYDLIVMGVSRRPGDKLYFGDTAASIITSAPCSLLLLSS
jgi:K+:H+ antiporter